MRITRGSRKPLVERRSERELFFWTAREALRLTREALKLILWTALSSYFAISVMRGHPLGLAEVTELLGKLITMLG